ncbi:hypothetical protein P0082_01075 [Candidatus Haliotispira prima]|uniref:DNRLRE domain-containing protein n=1 Tax=Candidatus Haliotispira prima TaxID=3034016 RepID=A0ABY8MHR0_9SPIO|nr:hypothetical protein P0082_01075 [Candidatus Haliotispira prima]
MVLSSCAPISDDSNDPPAAPPVKPSISFSAAAVVSSLQLEMSSSVALTNIGAVIRLASEAAPTKTQAEASAGYVSLEITANSPRKFSISQHYGSDFTDGLTLADVLTANTDYKLYLFFETNAISSETTVEGATINNDVAALPFTTAALPAAGDTAWNSAWTNEQFVGSLAEWGYSENQKGVFVTYIKVNLSFTSITLKTRTADNTLSQTIGLLSFGNIALLSDILFNMSKLDSRYPNGDNYYYVIASDSTTKILGKTFQLDIPHPTSSIIFRPTVPLTRYSSP